MVKEFVCIECPRGCSLFVTKTEEKISVSGNFCKRGEAYAINEVTLPKRILTTTMRLGERRVAVKTDVPVRKERQLELVNLIREFKPKNNYDIGEIIIENVDGEGANLICCSAKEI